MYVNMKGLRIRVYKIMLNGRFIVGVMKSSYFFEAALRLLLDIVLEVHRSFQTFISWERSSLEYHVFCIFPQKFLCTPPSPPPPPSDKLRPLQGNRFIWYSKFSYFKKKMVSKGILEVLGDLDSNGFKRSDRSCRVRKGLKAWNTFKEDGGPQKASTYFGRAMNVFHVRRWLSDSVFFFIKSRKVLGWDSSKKFQL